MGSLVRGGEKRTAPLTTMRGTKVFALCLLAFCKAKSQWLEQKYQTQQHGFLLFWFGKGDVNRDGLMSDGEFADWKLLIRDCGFLKEGTPGNPFIAEVEEDIYGLVSKTKYENAVKLRHADRPECLVDGEIDTYFTLMDTDFDGNLSFREIESGYSILRTAKHYIYHLFAAIDANVSRASFISSKLEGDGISLEDIERYVLTMD